MPVKKPENRYGRFEMNGIIRLFNAGTYIQQSRDHYTMIRFFILMLLMSNMPLAAAGPEAKPEAVQPHENKLDRLSKKLGLTEDQKSKIKHLLHANKDKIQTLKETDPEQLKSALSPEQKHTLEQLRKNPEALRKLKSEVKGKQLKLD